MFKMEVKIPAVNSVFLWDNVAEGKEEKLLNNAWFQQSNVSVSLTLGFCRCVASIEYEFCGF